MSIRLRMAISSLCCKTSRSNSTQARRFAGATRQAQSRPFGIRRTIRRYVHAVLDTRDSNSNQNDTMLNLSGMSIYGPPAFDGSSFSGLKTKLIQSGDTTDQYVGEQDIDLVRTNDQDFGTITGSTFQGGSIEVFGGPWSITTNTVLGSTADTYSPSALQPAFPARFGRRRATRSRSLDPSGREFRLVNLASSGYNNTIDENSFGGGAGQIGNELSYSAGSGQFAGINDPEVILAESSYAVLFEGRPGAVSADGRLLVLPDVRAFAAPIVDRARLGGLDPWRRELLTERPP